MRRKSKKKQYNQTEEFQKLWSEIPAAIGQKKMWKEQSMTHILVEDE